MPSQTGSIDLTAQVAANANAKDYTDSVEIGGRNLLRYTTKPSTTEWVGYGGNNTISRPGDEGLRITITGSGTHGIRVPLVADDCIADGEECMLSLDYRANVSSTGKIYLLCRTTPNVEHPAASITGDGEWHHLSMPISWSGMGDRVVFELLIGYISGTGNYFEVRDGTLKLEKGNKATDWSPAPEDASESIGAVQDDLDTTKSSVVWEGLCSSTTGTAAKVVECPGFTSSNLVEGARIRVRFKNNNTAEAISLNVNGTGAIGVYVGGADTSASNVLLIAAGADVDFTYTGTRWRIANQPGTYYATCAIAAATAAKTASYNGAVIYKGTTVNVLMTYENTSASATFNFQGTGARAIYYGNTTTVPTAGNGYGWKAGETATLVFDGKFWRFATNTANAAKTATNYISADSSGIKIANATPATAPTYQHQTANSTEFVVGGAKRSEISGDGLEVFDGDAGLEESVAQFGATQRIGKEDEYHTILTGSNFDLRDEDNVTKLRLDMGYNGQYDIPGSAMSFCPEMVSGSDSRIYGNIDSTYEDAYVTIETEATKAGRNRAAITSHAYGTDDLGETAMVYITATSSSPLGQGILRVKPDQIGVTVGTSETRITGHSVFVGNSAAGDGEVRLHLSNANNAGIYDDRFGDWIIVRGSNRQIHLAGNVRIDASETANVSLTNGAAYGGISGNAPKCRRWGKVVTIRGILTPKSDVTGGNELVLGTVPSGYRPAEDQRFLCQGSGSDHWLCTIYQSNGNLSMSRYGSGGAYKTAQKNSGAWLPISVTYVIE